MTRAATHSPYVRNLNRVYIYTLLYSESTAVVVNKHVYCSMDSGYIPSHTPVYVSIVCRDMRKKAKVICFGFVVARKWLQASGCAATTNNNFLRPELMVVAFFGAVGVVGGLVEWSCVFVWGSDAFVCVMVRRTLRHRRTISCIYMGSIYIRIRIVAISVRKPLSILNTISLWRKPFLMSIHLNSVEYILAIYSTAR